MEQVAVLPVPGVPVMRMFGPERSLASICCCSAQLGRGGGQPPNRDTTSLNDMTRRLPMLYLHV